MKKGRGWFIVALAIAVALGIIAQLASEPSGAIVKGFILPGSTLRIEHNGAYSVELAPFLPNVDVWVIIDGEEDMIPSLREYDNPTLITNISDGVVSYKAVAHDNSVDLQVDTEWSVYTVLNMVDRVLLAIVGIFLIIVIVVLVIGILDAVFG